MPVLLAVPARPTNVEFGAGKAAAPMTAAEAMMSELKVTMIVLELLGVLGDLDKPLGSAWLSFYIYLPQ